jgi:cell division septation protein DedD
MNRNNETGEFELVVGNRQLLSGFFIVVLLFAVAFAMGYVVGQNSPRSAKLQADVGSSPASVGDNRPQPVSSLTPTQPAATTPAGDPAAQQQPAADANQPTTQPAAQPPAEAPAAQQAAPAPAAADPAAADTLPPGSYWQVLAVNQPDAEGVVKTLKERGLPAMMTPGPKNLMRVMVGPYSETGAMSKAKTVLENLGFHPIRKQ